jgi:hypothetical protein
MIVGEPELSLSGALSCPFVKDLARSPSIGKKGRRYLREGVIAAAAGVRNETVDPAAWIDDKTPRVARHASADFLAVIRRVRPALLIGDE